MRPRLLTRTHYQIDEPAYLRLLVLRCSSCTQSDYADRVAGRLADALKATGHNVNVDAAKYCVDLARHAGLLTDNNTWTDLGMLLYTVSGRGADPGNVELTIPERLLFFRVFLEADGAALIFLGKHLKQHGQVPRPGQTWLEGSNPIANEMFCTCFAEYLDLAADPAERAEFRQVIQRRKARPFQGNSGRHQMSVHLQTMYRLGLVVRNEQNNSRTYSLGECSPDVSLGLRAFIECVVNVRALENVIRNRAWSEVAARVFRGSLPAAPSADDHILGRDFLEHLRPAYDLIRATGVPLCSLTSLITSLQIEQLSKLGVTLAYSKAIERLTGLQRQYPRDVHFHVDRGGNPAFIKLSDGVVP